MWPVTHFPSQVLPAEQAVLGGVPAEVEQAGLGVVQVGVALPLVLQELLELAPERRGLGPVLDRRGQQGADRLGDRRGEVGVVAEHDHDHAPVEDRHDLLLRGVVAERGERAVEVVRTRTCRRGWMAASRSSFRGTIHPCACRAFQIASPFSGPNASRNFCFSTSEVSGPSRLPVARSRKLTSSPLAPSSGSRWSWRRRL